MDSCIIPEEWVSIAAGKGTAYSGKSFNVYNAVSNQWQQTWLDNVGGSTEFLLRKFKNNSILFRSLPFVFAKDTMAVIKLSFYNLSKNKVR